MYGTYVICSYIVTMLITFWVPKTTHARGQDYFPPFHNCVNIATNVKFSIQSLEPSKVHLNPVHSFIHYFISVTINLNFLVSKAELYYIRRLKTIVTRKSLDSYVHTPTSAQI